MKKENMKMANEISAYPSVSAMAAKMKRNIEAETEMAWLTAKKQIGA
jgi:hypothetical protein